MCEQGGEEKQAIATTYQVASKTAILIMRMVINMLRAKLTDEAWETLRILLNDKFAYQVNLSGLTESIALFRQKFLAVSKKLLRSRVLRYKNHTFNLGLTHRT